MDEGESDKKGRGEERRCALWSNNNQWTANVYEILHFYEDS